MIQRAAIAVLCFTTLVLLGIYSLNGRANAQRFDHPPTEEVAPFPVVTETPVVNSGDRYSSPRTTPFLSPFGDSSPIGQRFRPSSALSTQPIIVAIKEGPQLSGVLVEVNALQVKTVFGQVSIPLDRIAGIRIADDPRQPATICLSNGDSLTGALATDALTIKTEWGSATIARDHIVSIVTSTEPKTWQQHEGRWRISPVEPQPHEDNTDKAGESKKTQGDAKPAQLDNAPPETPCGSTLD
jgi:hypothetical protein